jgi:hypothetical protein
VLQWLNLNSGAIQALTSVLTLVVTGALAIITWHYVRLTKDLADVARAQLRGQQEASVARLRELRTLTAILHKHLLSIPQQDDPRLSEAILVQVVEWGDFQFDRFRALASELSNSDGAAAAVAEDRMKWIGDIVHKIRATPRGVGYDWSRFPRGEFSQAWVEAFHAVLQILESLDKERLDDTDKPRSVPLPAG